MAKGSGRTKNLRFGASEEMDELFGGQKSIFADDNSGDSPISVDEMEDIYELDIDLISKDAGTLAASNVQNLLRLYNNKEFVDEHPDFKRRIDTEIEGLRKLYKMAKIDEETHDHLCKAISKNPSNASLYMAQVRLQEKIMSIDKEIRDRISNFNKIIGAFQLELNFAANTPGTTSNNNTTELDDGAVMSRGNKAFVEQMKQEAAAEESAATGEAVYDPDNLPPFCEVNDEGQVVDTDTGEVMGVVRQD